MNTQLNDLKHSRKSNIFAWIMVGITILVGIASIITARVLQTGREAQNTSASADTVVIGVSEDAFVTSSSPNGKSGGSSVVTVSDYNSGNIRIAFLKFDLSELAGKTITGAKLRLVPTLSRSIDKDIKLATNSWSESSLTWNTRPTLSSIVGSVNTSTKLGISLDINLDINSVRSYVGKTMSIAIDNRGTGNTLQFSSKEGTYGGAQLIVTYDTTNPVEPSACTIGINIATPTPTVSSVCAVEFDLPDTAVCWLDPRTNVPVNYRILSLPSTGGPFYIQTDWYVSSPFITPNHYLVSGPVYAGQTGTVYVDWPGVAVGSTQTVEIHVGLNIVDSYGTPVSPDCTDGMDYYWTPYVCPAPTPTTFAPSPTPTSAPTYCPWWKRLWGGGC